MGQTELAFYKRPYTTHCITQALKIVKPQKL